MSEYNIQMNKYNSLNVEYDQLYPATKIENVDGLNTALQKKVDGLESTDYPGCYYRMIDGVVEWINPPMALGGMDENGNPINEYRTTERWLGYPVYVKTVYFGAMENGKSVEVVKNPRHVIRCSAVIGEGNGTLPDIAPQALSQSSCFTSGITQNADGERVAVAISRIGTALGTSVTATVTVWYTKLTN